MKIRVLHSDGCGSTPVALQNLHAVLVEMNVEAEVERVIVTDEDDLAEARYFGSPTIQVNGVDVDPGSRTRTDYSRG